jgi:hypothetical protein
MRVANKYSSSYLFLAVKVFSLGNKSRLLVTNLARSVPPHSTDRFIIATHETQIISSLIADATDTETQGTNQIFAKPTFELKKN